MTQTPSSTRVLQFRARYGGWRRFSIPFRDSRVWRMRCLWSRLLSMQFGVSIFGVVLTVAAFMIGLGLGSLAGIRWAKKFKNPFAIFAVLEIAIAVYALLLPTFLHYGNGWLDQISGRLTLLEWYLLQGTGALCLLVVPAFGMGLGFALMLQAIDKSSHFAWKNIRPEYTGRRSGRVVAIVELAGTRVDRLVAGDCATGAGDRNCGTGYFPQNAPGK